MAEPRGRTGARRSRDDEATRSLGYTLGAVESGAPLTGLPVWAQRGSGVSRVRGTGDLVDALARAGDPERVIEVLLERGRDFEGARSQLPKPVIEVIRQIRGEAARVQDEVASERRRRGAPAGATTRGRGQGSSAPRASARVVRGFTALRAGRGASTSAGVGADRVMKLAKRLQELIHLAEVAKRRDRARQEVRLADDSQSAQLERTGAQGAGAEDAGEEVDIETLGREVLEVVAREFELRRERRMEDPDERSIWW